MTFGVLVDVCISVMAVMILLTLAATAINEMIADNILNLRGKNLERAISGLFRKYWKLSTGSEPGKKDLTGLLEEFYKDASIGALMEDKSKLKVRALESIKAVTSKLKVRALEGIGQTATDYRPPSAVEPATFAEVAQRVISAALSKQKEGFFDVNGDRVEKGVKILVNGLPVNRDAYKKIDFVTDYKLTMDRASGWYVRRVKTNLFFIGLFLVIGANLDLPKYAEKLSKDANLHDQVDATVGMITAAMASQGNAGNQGADTAPVGQDLADIGTLLQNKMKTLSDELDKSGVDFGWCVAKNQLPEGVAPDSSWFFCVKEEPFVNIPNSRQVFSWILIAFGITLGSQFWFDLFRTLVNLRTPGKTSGTVEELSANNVLPKQGTTATP